LTFVREAVEAAPSVAARVKEDLVLLRETRKAKKQSKAKTGEVRASA